MASFGPGFIPFTGFSPTLGAGDASTPSTTGSVQYNGLIQQDSMINTSLMSGWNIILRQLYNTLLGAAAGGTATATRAQIVGSPLSADSNGAQGGGVVPIVSTSLINRVTTATDVTNLKAQISFTRGPASYVADVSGNGGGSRLGW